MKLLALLASQSVVVSCAFVSTISISISTRLPRTLYAQNMMEPLAPARLNVEPEALVTCIPQLAKDVDYARAIQDVWKATKATSSAKSESMAHLYKDASGATCYGHVIRTKGISASTVPGIVFFHTGAGPHDVCLHWKADSLVTNKDIFPHGCVVLIADILSDDTGWAWSSDRTKYNEARAKVLDGDGSNLRIKLTAAFNELCAMDHVNSTKLGAMGWCLGGLSILELARMKMDGLKAMVTFHGVFGQAAAETETTPSEEGCSILVCHGANDPFISQESLTNAMKTMKQCGCNVTFLKLEGAKHGFTNPAQDYNPNEAFEFSEDGAAKAWSSALSLLRSAI